MKNSSLEAFGETLINDVRDLVYEDYLATKNGRYKNSEAENMRELVRSIKNPAALDTIILSIIDSVIFQMLLMLEENNVSLNGDWGSFNARDDSDGLPGEIFGEDGWIEKFSVYKPSE